MRKIDIFTHIFPEQYVSRMQEVAPGWKDVGKRVRGIPMLVDLDVRFKVMDAHEDYQQILSIATPPIEVYASPADAVDLARRANDGMAESAAVEGPARHPVAATRSRRRRKRQSRCRVSRIPWSGVMQIGQISMNARDIDRATAFYSDTLGLKLLF